VQRLGYVMTQDQTSTERECDATEWKTEDDCSECSVLLDACAVDDIMRKSFGMVWSWDYGRGCVDRGGCGGLCVERSRELPSLKAQVTSVMRDC